MPTSTSNRQTESFWIDDEVVAGSTASFSRQLRKPKLIKISKRSESMEGPYSTFLRQTPDAAMQEAPTATTTEFATAAFSPIADEAQFPYEQVKSIALTLESIKEFELIAKYDGIILRRLEESFVVRLWEAGGENKVIEAEIPVAELEAGGDRELALPGASLVWTIGFEYDKKMKSRRSIMYVRHLPRLEANEVKKTLSNLQQITSSITWE